MILFRQFVFHCMIHLQDAFWFPDDGARIINITIQQLQGKVQMYRQIRLKQAKNHNPNNKNHIVVFLEYIEADILCRYRTRNGSRKLYNYHDFC